MKAPNPMESKAPRVTVKGISKYFGKARALSDINIEVVQGEFCVLLGPSGCGKSTLLRIIAGLEAPTTGSVFINARDVTDMSPGDRDVAMVFQNYAIYPHMTVFENMAFPLVVRKFSKEEIRSKVTDAAKLLDLEQLLDRKPMQLSGGQRQRVAIGRAIVRRPTVFLFDEPLSNLDAQLRANMRVQIAQLHRKLNATTIYVTHDQVEAITLADRIVILGAGLIQQIDTPTKVYNRPANLMVARFVGTPPMNLVQGSVNRSDGERRVFFQSFALEVEVQEGTRQGRAFLGIRPEHIALDPEGETKGKVQFVEDTGSEKYLHVELGHDERMVVRVAQTITIEVGEEVSLSIDRSQVHVFEAPSEQIRSLASPGMGRSGSQRRGRKSPG
jgi:ABC-type sugar transport system ATPase subunit